MVNQHLTNSNIQQFKARMRVIGLRGCYYEPDICPLDALMLAFQVVQRALPQLELAADEDPSLQICIEFLREHMADKITLSDLSEQVHMSSRNLSKVFRDGVGTTPMRFLLKLRLNHSMKLLRHTDDTVEVVAEKCGFPDRYYFTRMLKKYRNTTPAAFRKNGRQREGDEEQDTYESEFDQSSPPPAKNPN